jgi:hypothetical protein
MYLIVLWPNNHAGAFKNQQDAARIKELLKAKTHLPLSVVYTENFVVFGNRKKIEEVKR